MSRLNIVLIEPQIPQNTGNIARTCAATGARLHLVEPMGFKIDDKQLKRSGLDYWHYLDISYYSSTEDFFEKNQGGNFFFFTTKGKKTYCEVNYPDNSFLIFGREDKGLSEQLLVQHPQSCLRLPMMTGIRSLNLSNTVAVAVYEVLRGWGFPSLQNEGRLTQYDWDSI